VHATVHNGLALQETLPGADEVAAFRRKHDLEGRQVLAIGGRLHTQKGVGKLLEMLALLVPKHPDLCLLVMGKAEIYNQEFLPQAQQLGVADRVRASGWLSGAELQQAYAAVDIFVTPSICFDTFGMVNLEAMEHSKPVIATSLGGSREVVLHGETGFIANPFDVPGFAGRIAELLQDPARAQQMGAAGRVRLEEKFTITSMAEAYLEQYHEALTGASSPI
jgi:spore coat protein SA